MYAKNAKPAVNHESKSRIGEISRELREVRQAVAAAVMLPMVAADRLA